MVTKKIKIGFLMVMGIGLNLAIMGCGGAPGGLSESKSLAEGTTGASDTKVSDGNGGVSITNTYSQPKQLGVGDIMYLDLNANQSSLDFAGVDTSEEFLFVVANTSSSGSSFSVQMSGDLSAPEFDLEDPATPAVESVSKSMEVAPDQSAGLNDITETFHDALRESEKKLAEMEIPVESNSVVSKSMALGTSPSVSVGAQSSFKVLASLSSTSSAVSVSATAECVGDNVVFYIDDRVTTEMLSSADVETLCRQFDSNVAKEVSIFGSLSDVNKDGKFVVLMTPQVNKLGALGGGIVTGFFNAIDLYANSSSNPSSNNMEILYVMVPDPKGEYGVAVSHSFAMSNLLPAVLPHELQHAISYNQHVFINKGMAEEAWLNEGLSHLAEDMMGQNQENPSRFAIYLQSPSSYPLVGTRSPSLAARGGAYLFLRFLYEQAENKNLFLGKIDQTILTGTKNVEAAFGGRAGDFDQFGELFLRWNVALAMTDRGVSKDRRFTYQPREQDPVTKKWSGVCLSCSASDNRGTLLQGVGVKSYSGSQSASASGSTAKFYKVSKVKDKLSFNGTDGASDGYGVLIRTK